MIISHIIASGCSFYHGSSLLLKKKKKSHFLPTRWLKVQEKGNVLRAMRSSTRPSVSVCSLFPSQTSHPPPPPTPPTLLGPLRTRCPPDDIGGDPGNPQFCLTAPAITTILEPITATFNIYSTAAVQCFPFSIRIIFLSRVDGCSCSSTISIIIALTPNLQPVDPLFYCNHFPAVIMLDLGGNSYWRTSPRPSHRTQCFKVQDWEG